MGMTVDEAQMAVVELDKIDRQKQLALMQAYHNPNKVIEAWKQAEEPIKGIADLAALVDPQKAEGLAIREAALKFVASQDGEHG